MTAPVLDAGHDPGRNPQPPTVVAFCGASPGHDPVHMAAAERCGRLLAERGVGLVYGGAKLGLMGALADAVLAGGGEVTGIIPEALCLPHVVHTGLTRLQVTRDMHTRQAAMTASAAGVLVLPGGLGTLAELFEMWAWAQLGLHSTPIGLLNTEGFFDPLLAAVNSLEGAGFLSAADSGLITAEPDPERLLTTLLAPAVAA